MPMAANGRTRAPPPSLPPSTPPSPPPSPPPRPPKRSSSPRPRDSAGLATSSAICASSRIGTIAGEGFFGERVKPRGWLVLATGHSVKQRRGLRAACGTRNAERGRELESGRDWEAKRGREARVEKRVRETRGEERPGVREESGRESQFGRSASGKSGCTPCANSEMAAATTSKSCPNVRMTSEKSRPLRASSEIASSTAGMMKCRGVPSSSNMHRGESVGAPAGQRRAASASAYSWAA
mmetsp:Transcript_23213/g.58895  ORF Transcript_23213/g.58895 Transcript_23213/m.58895 type:complete len:239 (-) Transcript_23213:786-1502(-)